MADHSGKLGAVALHFQVHWQGPVRRPPHPPDASRVVVSQSTLNFSLGLSLRSLRGR
eukprot:CAMPEP_0204433148 /NCGR_PEP_ID=MMETSP0470-20130426/68893_1 /ASSEMBLY_ACC=CAM_ASM_000385 /TAXON_ID=2969 /ORGANISM="Oxyrrhis marina" /LENGTH=56 /DNA_ID=CAMNT_0051431511 /DNA_START=122 /DNA_END=289 /DNA_ORIENTATION=-